MEKVITLANLSESTAQEVFDYVCKHLMTQRERSANTSGCQYRTYEGLQCAAGCLMSKEEYEELNSKTEKLKGIENLPWSYLVSKGAVPEAHKALIGQLQDVHDNTSVGGWREDLVCLAEKFKLNLNDYISE